MVKELKMYNGDKVVNAKSFKCKKNSFSLANSPEVQTAVAGEDPNWGRVVMEYWRIWRKDR